MCKCLNDSENPHQAEQSHHTVSMFRMLICFFKAPGPISHIAALNILGLFWYNIESLLLMVVLTFHYNH